MQLCKPRKAGDPTGCIRKGNQPFEGSQEGISGQIAESFFPDHSGALFSFKSGGGAFVFYQIVLVMGRTIRQLLPAIPHILGSQSATSPAK